VVQGEQTLAGKLRAEGRVVKRGRTLELVDCDVLDEKGSLVASIEHMHDPAGRGRGGPVGVTPVTPETPGVYGKTFCAASGKVQFCELAFHER